MFIAIIIFIIILVLAIVITNFVYNAATSHDKPEDFPASATLDQKCEHGHFYYDEPSRSLYIIGFGLASETKQKVENVIKSSSFADIYSSSYLLVDDVNRHIIFAKATKREIKVSIFDFEKLVGIQIVQDGTTIFKKNVLGGSLIGGALFGDTGAIVGGMSGDTTEGGIVYSYKIIFAVDDMKNPVVEYELLDGAIDISSDLEKVIFSGTKSFGNKVKSVISAVIDNASKQRVSKVEVANTVSSVAEEIHKLLKLKEVGILSNEEFEEQKKKLLNK